MSHHRDRRERERRRILTGALAAVLLVAAVLALGGCYGHERQHEPPPRPGGIEPTLERPAIAHTVAAVVEPPPPPRSKTCPVAVPKAAWERAIRAAARAAQPHRQLALSCTMAALVRAESAWNPRVASGVGAVGLAQLMPGTARDLGVADPLDPIQSIRAGTRYYAWQFGQWKAHKRTPAQRRPLALAGYNAGLGTLLNIQRREGCILARCFYPLLPEETRDYIWRIDRLRETGEWLPHPPDAWRPQ